MRKRKKQTNKKYLLFIGLSVLVAGSFLFFKMIEKPKSQPETKVEERTKVAETKLETKKEEPVVIKDSALLPVPYTLQGPLDNLSIHEESCEEAAALMYHYFLQGQTTFSGSTIIPPQTANDEMLKMKAWQVKNYGVEPDLSIEKLGLFMQQYYGYKYQTFKNITKDDIKREISAGHPVLVPVMTHSLKNPSYGPKSVYHILVIKGYNAQNVIANDAGIRGESIQYSWDVVFSAIDAQTPKMGQGREMVVLMK
ncbi:MAG: C39 family peptidase [Patescibacteria group bacterium]